MQSCPSVPLQSVKVGEFVSQLRAWTYLDGFGFYGPRRLLGSDPTRSIRPEVFRLNDIRTTTEYGAVRCR
jgi:hypothetical protein